MRDLTPKQSRFLAVALLLVLLSLAVLAIAAPVLLLHQHYDQALENLSDRLTRYSRVVAMRPGIESQLKVAQAKQASRFYLKSSGPSLAAAEIQDLAKVVIEQNGAKLTSMQILPHKDENGLRQVTVNIQLSGKFQALHQVVYALENTQPYLFIDNASIRSPLAFSSLNPAEAELYVQFDLAGFAMVKGEQ
jgi:general secretion pathway protein M